MKTLFRSVVVTALSVLPAFAHAATHSGRPRIASVDGAPTALLQKGVELREAAAGSLIEPGEHVRTDARTKVTIAYPDGSRLIVHPGTDVAVGESMEGVQSNDLRAGRVQGEITKAGPGGAAGPARKPLKFLIRTRTATLGVRGTQFVAAADAASGVSRFHTLEGLVEVASDPSALLGGHGTPIAAGKMVAASVTGLSEVQPFDRTELLKSLADSAFSGGAGPSAPAGPGAASIASSAASVASSAAPASAPPPMRQDPPPPRKPELASPAESPASAEQKKAEAERDRPSMHLLSFSVGVFFSHDVRDRGSREHARALHAAWTPFIPLPIPLLAPYLRGSLGGMVFRNGSLNNNFLVREYQLHAGSAMLRPLFVEVGAGKQVWANENVDGGLLSANAGLILSENGRWNRIYAGVSRFMGGSEPMQVRAGLGIQF